MKLPRVRLTVRQVMVVVAIAGLACAIEGWRRRAVYCLEEAARCVEAEQSHLWMAMSHDRVAALYLGYVAEHRGSARYNQEQARRRRIDHLDMAHLIAHEWPQDAPGRAAKSWTPIARPRTGRRQKPSQEPRRRADQQSGRDAPADPARVQFNDERDSPPCRRAEGRSMNVANLRRRIQHNLGSPSLLKLIGLVQWLNRCGVFGRGQGQEVDIRLGDDFDDLPGTVRDDFWADTLNESHQGIDETGEEVVRLHNLQEEGAWNW